LCLGKKSNYQVLVSKDANKNKISKSQLRKILLGDKTKWPNGRKIRVSIFNRNGEHFKSLLNDICDMSLSDYLSFWRRKIFSGGGIPPKNLSSRSDLISQASTNKDLIGVLDSKDGVPTGLVSVLLD
jgi:hypothetical protein